jgi:hypothetical protein
MACKPDLFLAHPIFRKFFAAISHSALLFSMSIASNTFAGRAVSHSLPIYSRPNWNPSTTKATGVLCITTGIGAHDTTQNSGEDLGGSFGHSALSLFEIEGEEIGQKNPESYRVKAVSTVPEPGFDKQNPLPNKTWQLDDRPGDHFLTFKSSTFYHTQSGMHCIPVSSKEKSKLQDFLKKRKYDKWELMKNCNDLAVEAFMGVLFNWKPLKQLLKNPEGEEKLFMDPIRKGFLTKLKIMTPHVVLKGLRNFQSHYQVQGTLKYTPRDKYELSKIEELSKMKHITVPLYDNKPADSRHLSEEELDSIKRQQRPVYQHRTKH